MARNSANSGSLGIRNMVFPKLLISSALVLGGCATSGIMPIGSYKTEITEPEIVDAYNRDAESHIKNKEYSSAWENYVITKNISGLEAVLEEYYKDAIIHDKIRLDYINKELRAMCTELRKENLQLEGFEKKVALQAGIYEDRNNPKKCLERAAILYEIIYRHDDAERCLTAWINKDENMRHDTQKIMNYYKRFSKDSDFSNLRNEALKRADYFLSIEPYTMDNCESAWIIGEALNSAELKKNAVKAGILCGSMNEVWNKRAFEVQEEKSKQIGQQGQQALSK